MIRQVFTFVLIALLAATPSLSVAAKIDRKYTPGTMTRAEYGVAHSHLTESKIDVILEEASEAFGTKYIVDSIKKIYLKSPSHEKISFEDLTPFVNAWVVSVILARLDFEDVALAKLEAAVVDAGEMAEKLTQKRELTVEEIDTIYSDISLIALTETFKSFGNLKAFEHQRIGRFVRETSNNMKTTWDSSILEKAGVNYSMQARWQIAVILPTAVLGLNTLAGPIVYAINSTDFNYYINRSDFGPIIAMAGFVGVVVSAIAVAAATGMTLDKAVTARGRSKALFRSFSPVGKECEKLLTETGEVVP